MTELSGEHLRALEAERDKQSIQDSLESMTPEDLHQTAQFIRQVMQARKIGGHMERRFVKNSPDVIVPTSLQFQGDIHG